jgi:hypothetical protein
MCESESQKQYRGEESNDHEGDADEKELFRSIDRGESHRSPAEHPVVEQV